MNAVSPIEKSVVRIVCASRHNQQEFLSQTQLGKSLQMLRTLEQVELCLFVNNRLGLSQVYNRAIEMARQKPALLVFIHDDVLISDIFWVERLLAGLQTFDIIGLAGNRCREPGQPSWGFKSYINNQFTWDQKTNLSGVIGHGTSFPPTNLSVYGPPGQAVKLLDGVLLASHSHTLIDSGLRFDERFTFHFYDMDFCRSAEKLNLTLGTWPLSVVHASGGNFKSAAWKEGYASYLDKWTN